MAVILKLTLVREEMHLIQSQENLMYKSFHVPVVQVDKCHTCAGALEGPKR